MRVLLITSVFPRSESDDQVPWLREICRRIKENGIEIEILAPSWRGLKSHVIDGVPVHRFRYGPAAWEILTGEEGATNKVRKNPLLVLVAGMYLWSGFWALVKLLCGVKINQSYAHPPAPAPGAGEDNAGATSPPPGRRAYDLVEVHWPFPLALMAIPASWTGIPTIYHYHSAEKKLAAQNWLYSFLFGWSLGWARAHVANSSYTAGLIKQLKPGLKIEVIAYGSPIDFAHPLTPARGAGENGAGLRPAAPASQSDASIPAQGFNPGQNGSRRKLLFVGRHIERKGITYLIEAMKLLSADYQLTIVGEGDQTESLKKQAVGDLRIVFAGRVGGEELKALYASHDIFVLPAIVDSRGDTEGLGVVLIEAIAAGMPIVASNVGGIPDVVIDGQTGLLVDEKSPQALANAIQRIGDDNALAERLVQGAREHAQKYFSWEAVTDQTVKVYQSVVPR